MSEMDDKNRKIADQLDHMSTEELEELLRKHSQSSDNTDMDDIFSILEVIERREKLNPSDKYTDVDTAWPSFQKNYRPTNDDEKSLYDVEADTKDSTNNQSDMKRTKTLNTNRYRGRPLKQKALFRTAAVLITIIVVLFSGTIVAKAFGYDLWGAVAKWTNETFGFSAADSPSPKPVISNSPSVQQYSDLNEALSDYGISDALAPSWLPDNFMLTEISVIDSPKKMLFNAAYSRDTSIININITRLNDGTNGTYEKDDQNITVYEKNDIVHYIMSNNDHQLAIWIFKNYECSISGNLSIIEIKKMIDSIYER